MTDAVSAAAPADQPPEEEPSSVGGASPNAEREGQDAWLSEAATGYVLLTAIALVQLAWFAFLGYLVLAAL